jgi:hypothetical protein
LLKIKLALLDPYGLHSAMPYCAQISRANPGCLLFLIDQSGSMDNPFPGDSNSVPRSKSATVADALNRLIQNVVLRSAKADGIRDYFRVGVIGYGKEIKAGLGGLVPYDILIPISRIGEFPLRVETRTKLVSDGAGGIIEQTVKFPVWFDPEASGKTPMCAALTAAGMAIKEFVFQYPHAYPPIVLNLTDGLPTDGDPQENAKSIRNLKTSDGHALLFNLLISSKPVDPDYFPASETGLTDNGSKLLFRMSSELPPRIFEAALASKDQRSRCGDQCRSHCNRAVSGHRYPHLPIREVTGMSSQAPMVKWTTVSIPKSGNSLAENEDAAAHSLDGLHWAVCDGASEGWESGPWARHLASAYVAGPPPCCQVLGVGGWSQARLEGTGVARTCCLVRRGETLARFIRNATWPGVQEIPEENPVVVAGRRRWRQLPLPGEGRCHHPRIPTRRQESVRQQTSARPELTHLEISTIGLPRRPGHPRRPHVVGHGCRGRHPTDYHRPIGMEFHAPGHREIDSHR